MEPTDKPLTTAGAQADKPVSYFDMNREQHLQVLGEQVREISSLKSQLITAGAMLNEQKGKIAGLVLSNADLGLNTSVFINQRDAAEERFAKSQEEVAELEQEMADLRNEMHMKARLANDETGDAAAPIPGEIWHFLFGGLLGAGIVALVWAIRAHS